MLAGARLLRPGPRGEGCLREGGCQGAVRRRHRVLLEEARRSMCKGRRGGAGPFRPTLPPVLLAAAGRLPLVVLPGSPRPRCVCVFCDVLCVHCVVYCVVLCVLFDVCVYACAFACVCVRARALLEDQHTH